MGKKVVISIPTIDGHVSGWTMASILGLYRPAKLLQRIRDARTADATEEGTRKALDPEVWSWLEGVDFLDTWQWDYDLARVRSRAARLFLEATDADFLLFVDSDVSFDPSVVRKLVALDLPIVSLPYPKRHIHWSRAALAMSEGLSPEAGAYDYVLRTVRPEEVKGELVEVEGVGMGCTLIRRDVLREMTEAYRPELEAFDNHPDLGGPTVMLFSMRWGELKGKRHLFGEDVSFCSRWKDLADRKGEDPHPIYLYVGEGSPAHHHGMHLYRGSIEGFARAAKEER
jgi:hypothetical protein